MIKGEDKLGDIKINNEVVSTIAAMAANEVPGIIPASGGFSFRDMLGIKDIDKGVSVQITDNRVVINIEVSIEYGTNIYDASHRLQKRVKDQVEQMTGLVVEEVNVIIKGVIFPTVSKTQE